MCKLALFYWPVHSSSIDRSMVRWKKFQQNSQNYLILDKTTKSDVLGNNVFLFLRGIFHVAKEVRQLTAKLALSLIKFMKYGVVHFFVIWIIRRKFKLCMYAKHSLITINLLETKAYTFVQFSDLAKIWHFCTPIIVNISIPSPLDPKIFDIKRIFQKRSKREWLPKLDWRLGHMWIMEK